MVAEDRDMQRRAAVAVLEIGFLAIRDQLFDLGHVAARGGIVQAGIDAQFALGRRVLRQHVRGIAERQQCEQAYNCDPRHGCVVTAGVGILFRITINRA